MSDPIILASSSPRRKLILEMAGFQFDIVSPDVDEAFSFEAHPSDIVVDLAKRKALAVKTVFEVDGKIILAADTLVALNGKIYGKPQSKEDAFQILSTLSGNTHHVYTGVCILFPNGQIENFFESTEVTFFQLSDPEIWDYIATEEPMDKAGAYGMQGKGCILVNKINGDYYNSIGLPIGRISRILKNFM